MKVNQLSKFLYIYTGTKTSLFLLLCMAVLTSVLETFGIGLIAPFLNLSSNPSEFRKIPLLQETYNRLNLQSSNQLVLLLGLLIIAIFVIKSIAFVLTNAYLFKISFTQRKKLISRMMGAYLRTPYTFFLERNTASITQNIVIETTCFTQEYLLSLLTGVVNSIIVFVILFLLAQTNLLLLLMIVGVLLFVFVVFEGFGKKIKKWGQERAEADEAIIQAVNHSMGGLKETRVIGCESYFEQQLAEQGRRWAKSVTLFRSAKIIFPTIIQNGLIISVISFICLASVFSLQNGQDFDAVLAVFVAASLRLIPSANQFINSASIIKNSSYSIDLIYSDLKHLESINESDSIHYLPPNGTQAAEAASRTLDFSKQVQIKEISYRYPNVSENVIKQISLDIEKGESIALIGKSGAGKTTLVDILLGLLKPQRGDITVDGVSVYTDLRAWQNLIGYIPQSIFLVDDTVERNIAFGVPDELINYERLEKAIAVAQLSELIRQLPEGIKTEVGERGVRLSGGQRQRIGIARAIYHEREILVLDEATAALDNETERLVSDAIQSLAGSKTLIIIAHRLSTVENCDRIYLLEQGKVAKSGNYREVVLGNT